MLYQCCCWEPKLWILHSCLTVACKFAKGQNNDIKSSFAMHWSPLDEWLIYKKTVSLKIRHGLLSWRRKIPCLSFLPVLSQVISVLWKDFDPKNQAWSAFSAEENNSFVLFSPFSPFSRHVITLCLQSIASSPIHICLHYISSLFWGIFSYCMQISHIKIFLYHDQM